MKATCAYVGLDVHKETIAVAVADAGRDGEVRFWGTVPNTAHHMQKLAEKLDERHGRVEFTYEAGPCGYEIYRLLKSRGLACQVIAPSHIPRKPGDLPTGQTQLWWYNRRGIIGSSGLNY